MLPATPQSSARRRGVGRPSQARRRRAEGGRTKPSTQGEGVVPYLSVNIIIIIIMSGSDLLIGESVANKTLDDDLSPGDLLDDEEVYLT